MAERERAITLFASEPLPDGAASLTMPIRKPGIAARRAASAASNAAAKSPGARNRPTDTVGEGFYRDLVWNLRNGVLAVTRDGRIAVMNEVAYRILGLEPQAADIGQPYIRVLKDQPEVCRIVAGAFELSHLPNRAELRLKSTGKVIGYTLSQVRDPRGAITGAALFFKDLTLVEQIEERERLCDRLGLAVRDL